jgi:glycerol dehydrogenase
MRANDGLASVAEAACVKGETIHNMHFEIQPHMLLEAMIAADAFGRQRRATLEGEACLPAVAHWSGSGG